MTHQSTSPVTTGLLPCPFCGASATIEEIEGDRFSVGCDSADEIACMGYQNFTTFQRRGDAVKAWNTRAYLQPATPTIDDTPSCGQENDYRRATGGDAVAATPPKPDDLADIIAAKANEPAFRDMKERLDANINWPRYLPILKVRPTGVTSWLVMLPSGKEHIIGDEDWRPAITVDPAQAGWQPIATAPKDDDVIVWCDEGMDIVRYSEREEDGPQSMGHDAGWWGIRQAMDPGRSMGNQDYMRPAENQPWAWMPSPKPPYDDEGEPLFPRAVALPSTDRCAKCGHPRAEHSYNGACYGLCGEFVPAVSRPQRDTL